MKVQFGPFEFDRSNQLLARSGQEVPLPPRVLAVLDLLVARPGQVVSKQELIETVWKDAFVSDTSLAEAISFLRQALGDDPQQPSYVQTVHRRGYRFVGQTNGAAAAAQPVPAPAPAAARDAWPLVLPWALVVLLAAISAAASWRLAHPDVPPAQPLARFEIDLPHGTVLDQSAPAIAVSADGSRIAFAACADACRLYTRPLDATRAEPIAGTEGGSAPFLSPDGSQIAFFADGKLKSMAIGGGAATTIADARQPLGGAWADDDAIVLAAATTGEGAAGGLLRIPIHGGPARIVASVDLKAGELEFESPEVMPGGRSVLATAVVAPSSPPVTRVVAFSVETGERTIVIERASAPKFVPPNVLAFVRDGDLMAAAFDASQLKVVGQPVVVRRGVGGDPAQVAVSRVGSMVSASGGAAPGAIEWMGADAVTPLASGQPQLASPSLSPDGARIAALAGDEDRYDLWLLDAARGAVSRVTFDGAHRDAAWTPDGRRLVAAGRAGPVFNLFVVPLDAPSNRRRLTSSAHHQADASVSPDGRSVAFTEFDPATGGDLYVVPIDGGTPKPFVRTPFDESAPAFSPDGRWIAYQSRESNRWEVYVRPFPGPGQAVAISAGGGTAPIWSRDGRTIYYASSRPGDGIMAVPLACVRCDTLTPGTPAPFGPAGGSRIPRGAAPDGRLLVERPRGRLDRVERLAVALQWTRELERLVPRAVVTSPK